MQLLGWVLAFCVACTPCRWWVGLDYVGAPLIDGEYVGEEECIDEVISPHRSNYMLGCLKHNFYLYLYTPKYGADRHQSNYVRQACLR